MSAMSSYMTSGWYEFLVPVRGAQGQDHLRVWIDMKDVVPMLKRLDLIYGDPEHPYCKDLRQVPDAARDLVAMVMDHIVEHPESVRRISATRGLFADLNDRFDVGRSAYPVAYPEAIDQVDLELATTVLMLPLLLDREPGQAEDGHG
jgi:hypothetical protein